MTAFISHFEDQPYLCHPGSQGIACAYFLQTPPRLKVIPYSYLLCLDLLGDRIIAVQYSFAQVELSITRDFPGRNQFIDDLSNFRVALVRESRYLGMRISSEPYGEKTEIF